MITLDVVREITVDEFQKMIEAGVFPEDDRIELIEGYLIPISPIGWEHVDIVNQLTTLFVQKLGKRFQVSVQNPLQLSDKSQPQPDIALVTPSRQRATRAITAAATFLVVEVADSTLHNDRTIKVPLYAAAGIPEVWVIDVNAHTIEQYHTPENGAYTVYRRWEQEETITTTLGIDIAVNDVVV